MKSHLPEQFSEQDDAALPPQPFSASPADNGQQEDDPFTFASAGNDKQEDAAGAQFSVATAGSVEQDDAARVFDPFSISPPAEHEHDMAPNEWVRSLERIRQRLEILAEESARARAAKAAKPAPNKAIASDPEGADRLEDNLAERTPSHRESTSSSKSAIARPLEDSKEFDRPWDSLAVPIPSSLASKSSTSHSDALTQTSPPDLVPATSQRSDEHSERSLRPSETLQNNTARYAPSEFQDTTSQPDALAQTPPPDQVPVTSQRSDEHQEQALRPSETLQDSVARYAPLEFQDTTSKPDALAQKSPPDLVPATSQRFDEHLEQALKTLCGIGSRSDPTSQSDVLAQTSPPEPVSATSQKFDQHPEPRLPPFKTLQDEAAGCEPSEFQGPTSQPDALAQTPSSDLVPLVPAPSQRSYEYQALRPSETLRDNAAGYGPLEFQGQGQPKAPRASWMRAMAMFLPTRVVTVVKTLQPTPKE